jgi:hypothetical protein
LLNTLEFGVNNLKPPSGKTSRTAMSVTTFLTHLTPVIGRVHVFRILLSPAFAKTDLVYERPEIKFIVAVVATL